MIDTAEKLAIEILGQELYENSPCQAHPYELIAEYTRQFKAENQRLREALRDIMNMGMPVQKAEHRLARQALEGEQ